MDGDCIHVGCSSHSKMLYLATDFEQRKPSGACEVGGDSAVLLAIYPFCFASIWSGLVGMQGVEINRAEYMRLV